MEPKKISKHRMPLDVDGNDFLDFLREIRCISIVDFMPKVGASEVILSTSVSNVAARLTCEIVDYEERGEVGKLCISFINVQNGGVKGNFHFQFSELQSASILRINVGQVECDSGVVLNFGNDGEIIVVASVYAGMLSILGAPDLACPDAEFSLCDYQRVPLLLKGN